MFARLLAPTGAAIGVHADSFTNLEPAGRSLGEGGLARRGGTSVFRWRLPGTPSRVEFGVTHSKQTTEVRATRNCFEGSRSSIFAFRFSNFGFRDFEKGVRARQLFSSATHSKQTIGERKGCQFFAMFPAAFSTSFSTATLLRSLLSLLERPRIAVHEVFFPQGRFSQAQRIRLGFRIYGGQ